MLLKLDELGGEIKELKELVEKRKEKLLELEDQLVLEIKSKTDEIDKLEKLLDRNENEFFKYKTEILNRDEKLREYEKYIEKLEKNLESFTSEKNLLENIKNENKILHEDLKNKNNKIKKQDEQISNLVKELENYKKFIDDICDLLNAEEQNIYEKIKNVLLENADLKNKLNTKQISQAPPEKLPFDYITGVNEILKHINNLLRDAKYRIILIIPSINDIKSLNFSSLVVSNIFLATFFDTSKPEHLKIIEELNSKYKINVRFYENRDRWGVLKDGDTIIIANNSIDTEITGYLTSDMKLIEIFSKIINDAWNNSTIIKI